MTKSCTLIPLFVLSLLAGANLFSSSLLAQSRGYYQHTPNGVMAFLPVAGKVSFIFEANTSRASRSATLAGEQLIRDHTLLLGETSPYAIATLNQTQTKAAEVFAALEQLPGVWKSLPVLRSPDGVEHLITERLVVKLRTAADLSVLQQEASRAGCVVERENALRPLTYHLSAADGDGLTAANRLMETGLFAWAQADMLTSGKLFAVPPPAPTDPLYVNQWALKNTATANQFYTINAATCATAGADMDVENAWISTGITGNGIKVAVLDQGVDLTHPDLNDNLIAGYSATSIGPTLYGPSGGAATGTHGTWCAGLIAAEANNGIGIAGIAYNADIMPVRCFFNDFFFDTWGADAIAWSWQNGADVLSCSWGGGGASYQINEAIHDAVTLGRGGKGCLVFFASGNTDDEVKFPASNPEVIAVGASTPVDERQRPAACTNMTYWGSSYGTGIDVMAPGTETVTTDNGGGYYNEFVGTSAACPNAAGVGVLLLAANPALTSNQARRILEVSCERVRTDVYTYSPNVDGQPNGTWNPEVGYGRVNATQAINMATLPAFDLALYVNHPHYVSCGTNITPAVTVTNYGTTTITSFDLRYVYDGGAPVVLNQSVTLATGASQVIALPAIVSATGSHTLDFSIVTNTLNGAQTDAYPADNTLNGIVWQVLAPATLPFTETFESNSLSAGYWEVVNFNNDLVQWEPALVEGKSGSYAARVNCSVYDVNGAQEKLVSRRFDLSSVSTASLGFTYAYKYINVGVDPSYNNYNDSLFVYASDDCGATWTAVYADGENGSNAFSTAPDGVDFFVPEASTDWCSAGVAGIPCVQIDVSAFTGPGKTNVRFMFVVRNHFGNALYIDDIDLRSTPVAGVAGGGYACGGSSTYPPVKVALSGPGPWDLTYTDGTPHTVTGITASPYLIHPTGAATYTVTAVSGPGGAGTVLAPGAVSVAVDADEVNPQMTLLPGIAVKCEAGHEPYVSASLNTAGNALLLDGTTGFVSVPAFNMTTNAFLVEAWIYPATLSGGRSLFFEINGSGDTLFHAFFRNNGATLVWRVFSGGAYRETSMAVGTLIPLTTWSHVAFHFTTAPQTFTTVWFELNLQIFVNGINRAASNFSGLTNLTGGTSLRIGQGGTGRSSFQGRMDEIRIWNRTLPEFTFLQLSYNRAMYRFTPQLARSYRCDEASGTALNDATSAQHGTLVGGVSRLSPSTAPLEMDFEWIPSNAINLDNTRLYGQVVSGYTGTLGLLVSNPYSECINYRSTEVVDMTSGVTVLTGAGQTRTANAECTLVSGPDMGWTHYYTYQAPATKEILLSLKQGGSTIGGVDAPGFALVGATTPAWGSNTGTQITAPYVSNPADWYVMNRYWKVTPTSQPLADVEVRTYFTAQDLADLNGSLNPDLSLSDLRFYKINGATDPNPDPDNTPATLDGHGAIVAAPSYNANGYWEYVSTSYVPALGPLQTWTAGTDFGGNYAQYTVASFSGGGGGGGGGSSGAFLPVNFLDVQAIPTPVAYGWRTTVEWKVSDEKQVMLYLVERSEIDGVWQESAQVPATEQSQYHATDEHLFAPGQRVQYRIRAIDSDGASTTSNTVEVTSGSLSRINLSSTNPAHPGALIRVNSPDTEYADLVWLDQTGKRLNAPSRIQLLPEVPLFIPVPDVPAGVYHLMINGDKNQAAFRMVVH